MTDHEAFLHGIPKFLRRPREPLPETPVFMTPLDPAGPPPAHVPDVIQAPEAVSGRRPGALVPPVRRPSPSAGAARAGAGEALVSSDVVDLWSRRGEPLVAKAPPAANFFAEARQGIESLFALDGDDSRDDEGDTAFQVTLPRSVIRQVRILAAQESTTQRAIILKALRLAGLAVPEGADIDRRILAGKRRQQA